VGTTEGKQTSRHFRRATISFREPARIFFMTFCKLRDEQILRYFPVCQSLADEPDHLRFPLRQLKLPPGLVNIDLMFFDDPFHQDHDMGRLVLPAMVAERFLIISERLSTLKVYIAFKKKTNKPKNPTFEGLMLIGKSLSLMHHEKISNREIMQPEKHQKAGQF